METMQLENGLIFAVNENGDINFMIQGNVPLGAMATAIIILQRETLALMHRAQTAQTTPIEVVQSIPDITNRAMRRNGEPS